MVTGAELAATVATMVLVMAAGLVVLVVVGGGQAPPPPPQPPTPRTCPGCRLLIGLVLTSVSTVFAVVFVCTLETRLRVKTMT